MREQEDCTAELHRTSTTLGHSARMRDFADLSTTQKQTQRVTQNEEAEKHVQMKEQDQTPEKELSNMKKNNLPDAKVKTLVIMMLNERRGKVDEVIRTLTKKIENTKMKI